MKGWWLFVSLVAALASAGSWLSSPTSQPPSAVAHGTKQYPWSDAERIVSNGGNYVVFLRTDPSPIPENAEFTATVWVLSRNAIPPEALTDVALDVDAFMPEHGHGMNRVPEITKREDGGFDVKGLLLHMGGNWELYFDVTRGAITERTQKRVALE
jgi:hypothetical protein